MRMDLLFQEEVHGFYVGCPETGVLDLYVGLFEAKENKALHDQHDAVVHEAFEEDVVPAGLDGPGAGEFEDGELERIGRGEKEDGNYVAGEIFIGPLG